MNGEFKFISENTIEHISFHDCHCKKLYYLDDVLIFEMEWLEVLPEHPLNPYNQAHQSGEGMVIIQFPVLNKCEAYIHLEEKVNIDSLEDVVFCDVALLGIREIKEDDEFSAQISLTSRCGGCHFAMLEIKYKKSYVMWNELKELSWFENK